MTLINIVIALVILGLLLYLIGLIPIDANIQRAIQIVVILFVVLWLLQVFGVIGGSLRLF
jgi:hypothetical protein